MFNRFFIITLSAASMIFCMADCKGLENYANSFVSDTIESGVTTIDSIADDAATGDIGISSLEENYSVKVDEFTCDSSWKSCVNGEKTRSATCSNTAISYTKDVSLDFFAAGGAVDTSCDGLGTAGNYVVKTGTETLIIPINGNYITASDTGGGADITKNTDGTISVVINGVTKTHVRTDNQVAWTHSIHTDPAAPLILNQLARNGRKISSGTIIVENETYGFTATLKFTDVTYTTGCCYPTGGTIAVSITGTTTETDTLTFSGTCDSSALSGPSDGTLVMITCTSSIY